MPLKQFHNILVFQFWTSRFSHRIIHLKQNPAVSLPTSANTARGMLEVPENLREQGHSGGHHLARSEAGKSRKKCITTARSHVDSGGPRQAPSLGELVLRQASCPEDVGHLLTTYWKVFKVTQASQPLNSSLTKLMERLAELLIL